MDFHSHTPSSWDYANGAGPQKEALKSQSPEDWLQRHMAWGLDAIVVTDHNSTNFISSLQKAYNDMDSSSPHFRELTLFPGFELTVNGGLHLLAIFDPAADLDVVSGTIHSCGFNGTRGESDSVTSNSFEKCIEEIRRSGGLSIAAHVDEACGLFWNKLTSGEEIRQLMRAEDMSHDEAVTRLIEEGKLIKTIRDETQGINNTVSLILQAGLDAIEVRNWGKLPLTLQEDPVLGRLARVTGSDSHMPRDIGRNGFSMIHMSNPNIEGLRTAFADGSAVRSRDSDEIKDSWSVRQIDKKDTSDWNQWPDNGIEKITLSRLKVAGLPNPVEMPLHPRLNVLVGGRGSGKSTFVHALRLATDRGHELPRYEGSAPVRESPAGDFWRWAQIPPTREQDGVIRKDESVVKVLLRTPAQQAELIWKAELLRQGAKSAPPTVLVGPLNATPSEDGGAFTASRFPMSIYSQKQVLEMSRGPAGLLEIIDREQNVASLEEDLNEKIASYGSTRAKIRELTLSLANEAQDTASLKDIVLELGKIQSPIVKGFQLRVSQARALLPQIKPDSPLVLVVDEIKKLADKLTLPKIHESLISNDDSDLQAAFAIHTQKQKKLDEIGLEIKTQAEAIQSTLTELNDELRASEWWKSYINSKAAYDELLGNQATSIDPARLSKLNQDREQLETKISKHKGTRTEIISLNTTGIEQLAAVSAARVLISEARKTFVAAHNAKGTMLRMTVVAMGSEMRSVERSLRDALGVDAEKFVPAISYTGEVRADSLLKVYQTLPTPNAAVDAIKKRIIDLIDNQSNEQGFADLQNNLRRQIGNTPSRREAIETWFPDDRLDLEYRTAESGDWKSISQGSIGQQTAAVLSFLLSFGNEPLVLDQPEDDLDTRMIMSLIVEQIRSMKEHRQIIIVTHNPNIVVHGDADLVHAMEDTNGQVHRNHGASGGLQEPTTRKFICDVMEGGAIAFRKRFDRMSTT